MSFQEVRPAAQTKPAPNATMPTSAPGFRCPSRSAAASASGIDAAEVLAVHSTLKETFSCATPSASATAADDPRVGLVRDEVVDLLDADAVTREHLLRRLGHPVHGVAVDLLAGHPQQRPLALGVQGVGERVVVAEDERADPAPAGRPRADQHRAGAVAEEHRGRAILVVGDPRERLGAADEDLLGAAALDQRRRLLEPVEEAAARRVDVENAGPLGTDAGGDGRAPGRASGGLG